MTRAKLANRPAPPRSRSFASRAARPFSHAAPGFTLIELLVVVAIIGILAAAATPALMRSIDSSRRSACATNLQQIGAAMAMYMADNNMKFPPASLDKVAFPGFGDYPKWFGQFEPYINKAVSRKVNPKKVFLCPAENRPSVYCSYALNVNAYSGFDLQDGPQGATVLVPLSTLKGAPSKTIYAGDSGGSSTTINWGGSGIAKGNAVEYRHSGSSRDQSQAYASTDEIARQNGVANFLFFDGHVENLRDSQLTHEMFYGN